MTKEKLTSIVDDIVENKSKREEYINRIEVLDKVKDLFLIPQLEMMTLRQIAEFYKVDIHTLQICYQRNKKEVDSDGTIVKNLRDFAKISKDTGCDFRKEGKINILEYEAEGNCA